MADITMCWGTDCAIKDNCYRYKAQPNSNRQAYFTIAPVELDENDKFIFCNYFLDMRAING